MLQDLSVTVEKGAEASVAGGLLLLASEVMQVLQLMHNCDVAVRFVLACVGV